jgi:hypothetical protein
MVDPYNQTTTRYIVVVKPIAAKVPWGIEVEGLAKTALRFDPARIPVTEG